MAVRGCAALQAAPRCCAAAASGCHGDEPGCRNALSCVFFFFFFTQRLTPACTASPAAAVLSGRKTVGGAWSSARGKSRRDLGRRRTEQGEAGLNNAEAARPPSIQYGGTFISMLGLLSKCRRQISLWLLH